MLNWLVLWVENAVLGGLGYSIMNSILEVGRVLPALHPHVHGPLLEELSWWKVASREAER